VELEAQGVDLTRSSVKGNALTLEETGILFVDTSLLRSLATSALLFAESDVDTAAAVGAIRARGVESLSATLGPGHQPQAHIRRLR
jgi:hypothetical protein